MTGAKQLIEAVAPARIGGMTVAIAENVRDAVLTLDGAELDGTLDACLIEQNWTGGVKVVLTLNFRGAGEDA